jgi:hypothetical protein
MSRLSPEFVGLSEFMRFVIDETSWNFDGLDPELCVEALEEVLDCIEFVRAHGHGCCRSDELFNMPIRDGRSFYELYHEDSPIPIPPEVRERIATIFSHLQEWDDWPTSLDAVIAGGASEFAPSIAWAHQQTTRHAANAVACISHPIRRNSGIIEVTVAAVTTAIWFVSKERDTELFFRWLITETTRTPEEMKSLSGSAFHGLDFVPGAFNGIKDMSVGYRNLVSVIVRHLSALSDDGARIFSGPWDRVAAEFGRFGVDISDENGGTKNNGTARAERTRIMNGETRIFWWHTKLKRQEDRIHLCPEKVRDGGRILIGIFCRHLTV